MEENEDRTFSVITLNMETAEEVLGYLGFEDTEGKKNPDGSSDYEISTAGYRAEAMSTGDGHIIAHIGPVSPRGVGGVRPDVAIELRNGHSLARSRISIEPRSKWVVTGIAIKDSHYKYPDGETFDRALRAFSSTVAHLRETKREFTQAARMVAEGNVKPRRPRRPGF